MAAKLVPPAAMSVELERFTVVPASAAGAPSPQTSSGWKVAISKAVSVWILLLRARAPLTVTVYS